MLVQCLQLPLVTDGRGRRTGNCKGLHRALGQVPASEHTGIAASLPCSRYSQSVCAVC